MRRRVRYEEVVKLAHDLEKQHEFLLIDCSVNNNVGSVVLWRSVRSCEDYYGCIKLYAAGPMRFYKRQKFNEWVQFDKKADLFAALPILLGD